MVYIDHNPTVNGIISRVTKSYLKHIDTKNPPSPQKIEADILTDIHRQIAQHNIMTKTKIAHKDAEASELLHAPNSLCEAQIADIMLTLHHIVRIKTSGANSDPDYDLLAIYMEDGPDRGIYVTREDTLKNIAKEYNYSISSSKLDNVIDFLRLGAPRVKPTTNRDLIAVNNGIFDYSNKKLLEFTPDYVYTSKSKVNYIPNAINPSLSTDDGEPWDIETWMAGLSDDPEIVNLLWEILSAIIRPHVSWNKSAWLYSESGNSGKGTLCALMRNLVGEGSYVSIPLSDFGKDFALEPLIRSTAIIVDENNVGEYIDKSANLKAVITNDVVPINRKFKTPISYQFHGFMVQCLNEFPRIKDKTDSFYRRQLFIPFDKCFTGGEKKEIKDSLLCNQAVLEYVLCKVLNTDFYTLSEPQACTIMMNEFRDNNEPVRQFFEELSDEFAWDLLPFKFLYDLYRCWYRRNNPSGTMAGKQEFNTQIIKIANSGDKWYCAERKKQIAVPKKMMNTPEHLIAEYDVVDWKNRLYTGCDIDTICMPKLQPHYAGLLRWGARADDIDT